MGPAQKIAIPKSGFDFAFDFVSTLIIVAVTMFAIKNVINGIALIASGIWIALVTLLIWSGSREHGGPHKFLIHYIVDLFGRHYAEVSARTLPSREIQFGSELLGYRFPRHNISIRKIETLEWNTGQATFMAGRDMDDWQVCLWYDHDGPSKSEEQHSWHRKPGQDSYVVGPSAKLRNTEALGMQLVALIQAAGAALVKVENSTRFIRKQSESTE